MFPFVDGNLILGWNWKKVAQFCQEQINSLQYFYFHGIIRWNNFKTISDLVREFLKIVDTNVNKAFEREYKEDIFL